MTAPKSSALTQADGPESARPADQPLEHRQGRSTRLPLGGKRRGLSSPGSVFTGVSLHRGQGSAALLITQPRGSTSPSRRDGGHAPGNACWRPGGRCGPGWPLWSRLPRPTAPGEGRRRAAPCHRRSPGIRTPTREGQLPPAQPCHGPQPHLRTTEHTRGPEGAPADHRAGRDRPDGPQGSVKRSETRGHRPQPFNFCSGQNHAELKCRIRTDGGLMRTINTGTMRGTRVGAGPAGEPYGRGYTVAKVVVLYYCANGHRTTVPFISTVTVPPQWECRVCWQPAGTIPIDPPPPDSSQVARYLGEKNHLGDVKSRRSPAEGDALMAESLARRDHPEECNVWAAPGRRKV